MDKNFLTEEEYQFMTEFLENGYAIFKIPNQAELQCLKQQVFDLAVAALNQEKPPVFETFFDQAHQFLSTEQLNQVRLAIIQGLNKNQNIRPLMYQLAKEKVHQIVGNELAMQRTLNLSIQLPDDDSSLLPIHSDVWMGNSPYEVVFWLPLVDCYKTKSMFVLPRSKSDDVFRRFGSMINQSADDLLKHVEDDLVWLDVPYGHGVLFSHAILHGNIVNKEPETRWSFNLRFKSVLTPYGDKALGESFLPITLRPATKIGFQHVEPGLEHV